MKILIISNLYPPYYLGGYEIVCKQVVDILAKKDHQINVLTSIHKSSNMEQHENGVKVHRLLKLEKPFHLPSHASRITRLKVGKYNGKITEKIIDSLQPDIIFLWSQLRITIAPAIKAEKSNLPVVYIMCDNNIKSYLPANFKLNPKKIIRYITDYTIFKNTTTKTLRFLNVIFISKCLRDQFAEMGLSNKNNKIIYQGIDIDSFPLKSNPGHINHPAKILYVGQLHHYKGVHTIIKAVDEIIKQLGTNSCTLTICGSGNVDYLKELKNISKNNSNISFMSKMPQSELSKIYRNHDIFVFPSIWKEPFGLTHLEAMASGIPVISTINGGQGEFLENNVNSLVFTKEDHQELAQKIVSLMKENGKRKKLIKTARELVENKFNIDRFANEINEYLKKISLDAVSSSNRFLL